MERQSYVAALIGAGVGPSLTPPMHEREGAWHGINYVYRTVDLDALGIPADGVAGLVDSARDLGFDGLNITHPCKQVVLKYLDSLSPDVVALGAANTVVFQDGKAVGHNTDKSGFVRGFRIGLPDVSVGRIVVIGAGGAGAAVSHALLSLGTCHIDVFDLEVARARALADSLRTIFADSGASTRHISSSAELNAALRAADGLVHATPTGMAAHPGLPVPGEVLRSELWVADVVYRPLETALVRAARERGCRVLDGGRMAVFQAADAFELFTGIAPDPTRMRSHFHELIANPATGEAQTYVCD